MKHTRLLLSLVAMVTAVALAYLMMVLGLDFRSLLSPANTQFAIVSGSIYGFFLVIVVNLFPHKDGRVIQRVLWTMGVLHLIVGTLFWIWIVGVASV